MIILAKDLFLNEEMNATEQRAALRRVQAGELYRVAPGIFSSLPENEWPDQLRRERVRVLAALFPNSIVGYRTAFDAMLNRQEIFLNYSYSRVANLPGLRINLVKGAAPQHGDMPMSHSKLYFPSEVRILLDNLSIDRSGHDRNVPAEAIEERLMNILHGRGENALNAIRDRAGDIAPLLGREREFRLLDKMIGNLLGTRPDHKAATSKARYMALGLAKDRLELFDKLAAALRRLVLPRIPDPVGNPEERKHFAFLESYFSNFIEGTRFAVEEAIDIALHGKIVEKRPKDSHDILGVFMQAEHPGWRAVPMPQTEAILAHLQDRHRRMLEARPEVQPGEFKLQANAAGNTRFVEPRLVRGTLVEAVKRLADVPPGFPRALMAMFIVAEIHPFSDGNGRLARLMMNAELTHAGEGRIIVPSLYREEYLDCLRVLTREGNPEPFIKVMQLAQEWTGAFRYADLQEVIAAMKRCNAFEESRIEHLLLLPDGTKLGKQRQEGGHATP